MARQGLYAKWYMTLKCLLGFKRFSLLLLLVVCRISPASNVIQQRHERRRLCVPIHLCVDLDCTVYTSICGISQSDEKAPAPGSIRFFFSLLTQHNHFIKFITYANFDVAAAIIIQCWLCIVLYLILRMSLTPGTLLTFEYVFLDLGHFT